MHVYRYRSNESLFEYKELETQTIYFSPPEKLNDPMEGMFDIFWKGDEILWKCLIEHYIRCLTVSVSAHLIDGKKHLNVFHTRSEFKNIPLGEILKSIQDKILSHKKIKNYPRLLSKYGEKIRKEVMAFILETVHYIAIDIIMNEFNIKYIKNSDSLPEMYFCDETFFRTLVNIKNKSHQIEELFASFDSIKQKIKQNRST